MPGLGPGIHDKQTRSGIVIFVDGRAKPGHDAASWPPFLPDLFALT
jgi:hypothetical protein